MPTRNNVVKNRFTKATGPRRSRPEDGGPLLVLLGLVARDGSGELAFCSSKAESPTAFLLDTSTAWEPDGDVDLAAFCQTCRSGHWTIPFVTFLLERGFSFEDGIIMIGPERFLA